MSLFDWLWGKRKTDLEPAAPQAGMPGDTVDAVDPMDEALEAALDGPSRPVLHMFQFATLPEAAFQNHPELIRELEGGGSWLPLVHFRSKAHLRCIQSGLMGSGMGESDAEMDAEDELFKSVAVHPHKRNGYTVHVVTMPTPQSPPEAHFVAIVHKDGEPREYGQASPSTRYFTLEKSFTPLPALCECRPDGTRRNYGEGPAPEMAAFVEAVFERIAVGQPGSNRVLLEDGGAALMMLAPPSSKGYHVVTVEFEDGTRLSEAKVYRLCELELPPEFIGKKIKRLGINTHQG